MLTAAAVTAVTSAAAAVAAVAAVAAAAAVASAAKVISIKSGSKLYFALIERTYSEGGQRLSQFVVRVRPQYLCDHSRSISVQMLLPQYFVTSAAAATCMLLSRTIYKTQYKDL